METADIRAGLAKLSSLVPADEECWLRFQHAVRHLPKLVEQRKHVDLVPSRVQASY